MLIFEEEDEISVVIITTVVSFPRRSQKMHSRVNKHSHKKIVLWPGNSVDIVRI